MDRRAAPPLVALNMEAVNDAGVHPDRAQPDRAQARSSRHSTPGAAASQNDPTSPPSSSKYSSTGLSLSLNVSDSQAVRRPPLSAISVASSESHAAPAPSNTEPWTRGDGHGIAQVLAAFPTALKDFAVGASIPGESSALSTQSSTLTSPVVAAAHHLTSKSSSPHILPRMRSATTSIHLSTTPSFPGTPAPSHSHSLMGRTDVVDEDEEPRLDIFLAVLKGSLDRIARERQCSVLTSDDTAKSRHQSTAVLHYQHHQVASLEQQRRRRNRAKSMGASINTVSSSAFTTSGGADEFGGYTEDDEASENFMRGFGSGPDVLTVDDEGGDDEDTHTHLTVEQRRHRYRQDSTSSARLSTSTNHSGGAGNHFYTSSVFSGIPPRSNRTSDERPQHSRSNSRIPALPTPAPPPSYMPISTRHRHNGSVASLSPSAHWQRPDSISSNTSGGGGAGPFLSPNDDPDSRRSSWHRHISSPSSGGGPSRDEQGYYWARPAPASAAPFSYYPQPPPHPPPPQALHPPPMVLVRTRSSHSSSGAPSFEDIPSTRNEASAAQHGKRKPYLNASSAPPSTVFNADAAPSRSVASLASSTRPSIPVLVPLPKGLTDFYRPGAPPSFDPPLHSNVLVADVLPMATHSGRLTTRYFTRGVFGARQVWKSRFFVLVGHTLYRFKTDDPNSQVLDMMKLTPLSVAFVSDDYPGKQWCLEIRGACSSTINNNTSAPPSISGNRSGSDLTGVSRPSSHRSSASTQLSAFSSVATLASTSSPTVAPSVTIIWEQGRWYADAPDGESLKIWLNALKSAIIRASYANRALPPSPKFSPTIANGSISDLSLRRGDTPRNSVRRGLAGGVPPSYHTATNTPPLPPQAAPPAYASGDVAQPSPVPLADRAYRRQSERVQGAAANKLLVDTSSNPARGSPHSMVTALERQQTASWMSPGSVNSDDGRHLAMRADPNGSSLSVSSLTQPETAASSAHSPLRTPVSADDCYDGVRVVTMSAAYMGQANDGIKRVPIPQPSQRHSDIPRGASREDARWDSTPDQIDDAGFSSSGGQVLKRRINRARAVSASISSSAVQTPPSLGLVSTMFSSGLGHGPQVQQVISPTSAEGKTPKFLSMFTRSVKASRPSSIESTPSGGVSRSEPSSPASSSGPSMLNGRRPSAAVLAAGLSPVMEARAEELDAPVSNGSRRRV